MTSHYHGNKISRTQSFLIKTQTFQPLNHANLECLKQKASKNPEIGTSNLEIFKICIKENQKGRLFLSLYSLPYWLVVSVVLSCCSLGSDEKILFHHPHSWDGE